MHKMKLIIDIWTTFFDYFYIKEMLRGNKINIIILYVTWSSVIVSIGIFIF